MPVAVQQAAIELDCIDRIRIETLLKRRLGNERAKSGGRRACHAKPNAIMPSGDEHTHRCIARGRIGELHIARGARDREAHGGQYFARPQRRLEQVEEEIVRGNLSLARYQRCAQRQNCGRIIGSGISVGGRSADRAAISDMRVSDSFREPGQRRYSLADNR